MFIGRKNELEHLNKLYDSDKFEFVVMYGRRRVGKTRLLTEFAKDKRAIYYVAEEQSRTLQIESLSDSMFYSFDKPNYITGLEDYDTIFEFLIDKSKQDRLVLVFDEFPYMVNSDKNLLSKLQKYVDTKFKDIKLMIILCGSSISFMEDEVLSYKSPLFGRRTSQMEIEPFNFYDGIKFFEGYTDEEKVISYSIVGGVAQYLELWNSELDIEDNIKEKFLSKYSYLYDEPLNLLKQELREPNIYSSIIKAISNGYTKLNEIATKIGEPYDKTAVYIKTLLTLRIVEKIKPMFEKETSKKTIYKIKDNLFKFIYRFIYTNVIVIEQKKYDKLYNDIKTYIPEYVGLIFEDICKDYLIRKSEQEKLPFIIENMGKWWGTNNKEKKQEEIDIIAIGDDKAIFCECKWRKEKTDVGEYEKLVKKSEKFKDIKEKYYYIFSKSGFKSNFNDVKNKNLKLIDLKEIVKG